jgi:hypothetical protein
MIKVVWADEPTETLTVVVEKENAAAIEGSALTPKVTGPLKLLVEVTDSGIPSEVAPGFKEIEVDVGVKVKSGLVPAVTGETSPHLFTSSATSIEPHPVARSYPALALYPIESPLGQSVVPA